MNDYLVTWRFGLKDDTNHLAVKACSVGEAMQKAYAQLGSNPLMWLTARRAEPSEVAGLRVVS
jgi:hypothetical protein